MKNPKMLPSREAIRAEKSRRRLADFFRYGWHVLEQDTPLEWNWHLDAMCDHIQAALEDWIEVKKWQKSREQARNERKPLAQPKPEQRIRDLLINVPPGTSKSRVVSVYTLPWMWLHWPSFGAIYLSGNRGVALRDALYCRDVLLSSWYQEWFAPEWKFRQDRKAISNYGNSLGGSRLAFGYFARIIGERKDALFVDDANDPEQAKSDRRREAINMRWDSSIGNRVNDLAHSLRIGVQQRVDAGDWSGHWISKNGLLVPGTQLGAEAERRIVQLCIPMEFEPNRLKDNPDPAKHEYPRATPIDWTDPRTQPGELLDASRFPLGVVNAEKERLGSYGAAGQLQQRPAPIEGGIWKRYWWRYWVPAGVTLPPVYEALADGGFVECPIVTLPTVFDFSCQSWDMAFGKSDTSSMVVGQVWKVGGANRFLIDQVRGQMDFLDTQSAVVNFSARHPEVESKFIENKANGPAIISSLRSNISGIVAVEPEGDKVARALAEQPTLESGHIYLPHPLLPLARTIGDKGQEYNWVTSFVDESASFPTGLFKDVVDTASQALMRIRKWIVANRSEDENRSTTGRGMTSGRPSHSGWGGR